MLPRGGGPRPARGPVRRRSRLRQVVIVLAAVAGIGLLLYPFAAGWFSARVHEAEISGYVDDVQRLPLPEKEAQLLSAHEYNEHLAGAPLGDPYGARTELDVTVTGTPEYRHELDATSVMARVSIPEIGVDLPVYHGTDARTLARGAGHLFGSSLPVGGPGTHAVLTGHSGQVSGALFDELHRLEMGDTFTISVLDEVLTYQVDQVLTVQPDDTDALQVVPGRDYVSLVTCTPIGVNSHRLLVRGTRVATGAQLPGTSAVPGTGRSAGFPWWVLGIVAVPGVVVLGLRPRRPDNLLGLKEPARHAHPHL